MTANQVAYWQLQEAKRHNATTEGLTADIQEAQKKRMTAQNVRDAIEGQSSAMNAQTNRSNLAVNQMNAETNRRKQTQDLYLGIANAGANIMKGASALL